MNRSKLKTIRDNIPHWLKYLTGGIIRRNLLNNANFIHYLNIDSYNAINEKDKFKENQFKQLKELLIYCENYVPYYQQLFKNIGFVPKLMASFKDIEVIPYLTRELIRENFNSLISNIKVKNGYYYTTTGGSTGEPLRIILDYDSFYKENGFVYRYRKNVGYDFKDKLATFRGGVYKNTFWKLHPVHNEILLSPFKLNGKNILQYVERITKFEPLWLNGYPSAIYYFAKLMSVSNLKFDIKLKGIFFCSETVDKEQRNFIESFFKTKTHANYGHSERAVIANEIFPFHYQFDPLYGFTEFIPLDGEKLGIVGTGFLNKTMPLIRYKTEDVCESLGNNLYRIVGRRNVKDYLVGINDEKLYISSFCYLNEIFPDINHYQFVQNEIGKTDLNIVTNFSYDNIKLQQVQDEVNYRMRNIINIRVSIKDNIELTSNGKMKLIINKI